MWFLAQDYFFKLENARKKATEIGKENLFGLFTTREGCIFKRNVYLVLYWKWIEKDLVKKSDIDISVGETINKEYLVEEFFSYLDDARWKAMKVGRENVQGITPIIGGRFFKKTYYALTYWVKYKDGTPVNVSNPSSLRNVALESHLNEDAYNVNKEI